MLDLKRVLVGQLVALLLLSVLSTQVALSQDDDAASNLDEESLTNAASQTDDAYVSPKLEEFYLYENFDDSLEFQSSWVKSADPKYNGVWNTKPAPDRSQSDLSLILSTKARHHAISTKLVKPFKFNDGKPLIVQYEVQYREGLDCGGSYVKLLRAPSPDLSKLDNETPYTIMFGPDKCGSDSKLHFIIQYKNPKSGNYEEKHWKSASKAAGIYGIFGDKKHHLVKLMVKPDNTFEIFLDDQLVGSGSLLEEFEPPINPPKEIVDVNDKKPENWDDRVKIEDPSAVKPDDWDEDAPKKIPDPTSSKPDDWLEEESELVPDPEAHKPDDWDTEMDGQWEAPLVPNPKCAGISGCGEWKAPMIANPAYKGKWRSPLIDNPAYKGIWEPRMIPNPDYYHDEDPFKSLTDIDAIAFELWSMSESVAFDNVIITDDPETASLLQALTWQTKKNQERANSPSVITQYTQYFQQNPWLLGVAALAVGVSVCLFVAFCCVGGAKESKTDAAERKKTDKSRPDEKIESEMAEDEADADVDIGEDRNDDDELPEVLEDVDDEEEEEVGNYEEGDEEGEEEEEEDVVEVAKEKKQQREAGDRVRSTRARSGRSGKHK